MPFAIEPCSSSHHQVNLGLDLQVALTNGMEQRCHWATSEHGLQNTLLLPSWNIVLPGEAAEAGLMDNKRTQEAEMNHFWQGSRHAEALSKAKIRKSYPGNLLYS